MASHAAATYRALHDLYAADLGTVYEGDIIEANHPILKGNEEHFEKIEHEKPSTPDSDDDK
jgi:hypothetical protein